MLYLWKRIFDLLPLRGAFVAELGPGGQRGLRQDPEGAAHFQIIQFSNYS